MAKSVAVIIGDFQYAGSPNEIVNFLNGPVAKSYNSVYMICRTGEFPFTSNFPIPYSRIRRMYGNEMFPLMRTETDKEFSQKVDDLLNNFGEHHTKYHIYIVNNAFKYTGKNIFKECIFVDVQKVLNNYNQGLINGINNRFGGTLAVVDIAVITDDDCLLIGKKTKHKGLYCLPGGFVDPKIDSSAEAAVVRELKEETGYNLKESDFKYVLSKMTKDSRVKGNKDSIMTFLYLASVKLEDLKIDILDDFDDLESISKVHINDLDLENFIEPHRDLIKQVLAKYRGDGK